MPQRVIVIIPARLASTRYPNKPLAKILGLPMVEHVRRRALLAPHIAEVIVATCDREIFDAVTAAGGRAVMTAATHQRASDRAAEAMRSGLEGEVVVIAQGDEPTLIPESLWQVAEPLVDRDDLAVASLLSPLAGRADFDNPNIVKAACDRRGHVIFFSRAPIPHFQKAGGECPVYRETGIRAFRADFLQTYCALPETPFERAEAVDMLRVLEHGYRILGVPVNYSTLGVDHPEDVPLAEQAILADPLQHALYEQTLALGAA